MFIKFANCYINMLNHVASFSEPEHTQSKTNSAGEWILKAYYVSGICLRETYRNKKEADLRWKEIEAKIDEINMWFRNCYKPSPSSGISETNLSRNSVDPSMIWKAEG